MTIRDSTLISKMSDMLKWACSFLFGSELSEVTIGDVPSSWVQCGEEKLLCSIELTDPKASFTTYHTNEIKVSGEDGSVFKKGECEINIRKISARTLSVYCLSERSGKVIVQLDLGKWYTFKGKSQLPVLFLPSCPANLNITKISGSNYVGHDIVITLDTVTDRFENKVSVCKHDITVTSDPKGAVSLVDSNMNSGKYTLHVRCHIKCKAEILIALKFRGMQFDNERCHQINPNDCIFTGFLLNIHHAPISWDCINARVVSPSNDRVIAGSPFLVEVKIDDVFGAPAHPGLIRSISAITSQNRVLISRLIPKNIQGNLLKIIQTEAGRHSLSILLHGRLTQNSNRHLNIHVLPSSPTTLRCVKAACTPNESEFKPEENALYYGAWSTIQADVTDEYENVCNQVRDDDYEVHLKALDNKGTSVALQRRNMKIVNGKLCVHVLPKEIGLLQLIVLLKDKRNSDKESTPLITKINVLDPPCSLSQSKIKFDSDGVFVAGREHKFELRVYDVFGNPVRKTSTAQCNITARIMPEYSRFRRKACHENLKKNIVSQSEDVCLTWSLTMEKAGPRQVEVAMQKMHVRKVPIQVIPSDPHALTKLLLKAKTLMDPNFTGDANSLYNDQWSSLEAVVSDKYNNVVTQLDGDCNIQLKPKEDQGNEIEVTCKDATIKDGRLRLQVKGKGVGKQDFIPTLTSNFEEKPDEKYHLQPVHLQLIDAPVSLTLSEIEKPDSRCVVGRKSKLRIIPFDVFGNPVMENSTAQCNWSGKILRSRSQSNLEEEHIACKNVVKSPSCFVDVSFLLTKAGERHFEIFDNENHSKRQLSLKVLPDVSNVHWELVNNTEKTYKEERLTLTAFNITQPLDLEFDSVEEYDNELVRRWSHGVIHCREVTKREILGPDHSHINNIRRVCKLDEDPEIEECIDDDDDKYIAIKLSDDENVYEKTNQFYETLLHLLKALCYREQASEADEKREHWKETARESYNKNCNGAGSPDWSRPSFCSGIKEKYATIMNKYHEKACDEFFAFFNAGRSQSEIDLHGLLVADENKLKQYERQLQKKKSNADVEAKVQEEREKGDEAIRKLKERLDEYDLEKAREDKETWLEIIVGSGHHSKYRQAIRPKVEEYLRERKLEFEPVNKGALVHTYEEYEGSEPCFGEYYCNECDHRWRNKRSWVGKWQGCYKCYDQNNRKVECPPLKQRQNRKWLPYKPTGAKTSAVIPHLPELCEKCEELDGECPKW